MELNEEPTDLSPARAWRKATFQPIEPLGQPSGGCLGIVSGEPLAIPDDLNAAVGEVFRGVVFWVVAAVAHLLAEKSLGCVVMALGFEGGDEVEAGAFLGGGDAYGEFGGRLGYRRVALGQAGGGDHVGDVDDRALEDLVESLTLTQPGSAGCAELSELASP